MRGIESSFIPLKTFAEISVAEFGDWGGGGGLCANVIMVVAFS